MINAVYHITKIHTTHLKINIELIFSSISVKVLWSSWKLVFYLFLPYTNQYEICFLYQVQRSTLTKKKKF